MKPAINRQRRRVSEEWGNEDIGKLSGNSRETRSFWKKVNNIIKVN